MYLLKKHEGTTEREKREVDGRPRRPGGPGAPPKPEKFPSSSVSSARFEKGFRATQNRYRDVCWQLGLANMQAVPGAAVLFVDFCCRVPAPAFPLARGRNFFPATDAGADFKLHFRAHDRHAHRGNRRHQFDSGGRRRSGKTIPAGELDSTSYRQYGHPEQRALTSSYQQFRRLSARGDSAIF